MHVELYQQHQLASNSSATQQRENASHSSCNSIHIVAIRGELIADRINGNLCVGLRISILWVVQKNRSTYDCRNGSERIRNGMGMGFQYHTRKCTPPICYLLEELDATEQASSSPDPPPVATQPPSGPSGPSGGVVLASILTSSASVLLAFSAAARCSPRHRI